jgi:hypothetical protein
MAQDDDSLDTLQVVTPCSVPWAAMQGDDRVRFCDLCRKSVYNIEAMGRAEALSVIRRAEGGACVRIRRRPDGTVTAGDCRSRLRRARRRGLLAFAFVLFVALPVQLVAQAFGLHSLAGLWRPKPAPWTVGEPAPRVMGQAKLWRKPKKEPVVIKEPGVDKPNDQLFMGRIGI